MRRLLTLLILLASISPAVAAEPQPWTTDEVEVVHNLIRRQPGEWRWAEVPWHNSMAEAQRQAAREGKPLFVTMAAQGSLTGCL